MRVELKRITLADHRRSVDIPAGEVVENQVDFMIDGVLRSFHVYLRAGSTQHWDSSLLYGDPLLEELFRFNAAALNAVMAAVGRARRGQPVHLPILLVDDDGSDRVGDTVR